MRTQLSTILKLMSQKYPTKYADGMNPVLFIYDDESGKILKNAMYPAYGYADNVLFGFSTIQELIDHLKSK